MNKTIGNHDLITAENIMGYLQARLAELEAEAAVGGYGFNLNTRTATRLSARINEVREMLIHVEGDLDSTIHDRFATSAS